MFETLRVTIDQEHKKILEQKNNSFFFAMVQKFQF